MRRLLLGSALALVTAAAAASAPCALGLDAAMPAPVRARPGHGVALCPGPAGLQTFDAATKRAAVRAAATYRHESLAVDLRNADRAWWPRVHALWRSSSVERTKDVVVGSEPAASSGFAVFLRPACGARTVSRSLMVTVGPSRTGTGPRCDACNVHLFYISRAARPLLWYVY